MRARHAVHARGRAGAVHVLEHQLASFPPEARLLRRDARIRETDRSAHALGRLAADHALARIEREALPRVRPRDHEQVDARVARLARMHGGPSALLIDPRRRGLRHPSTGAYNAGIETPVTPQAPAPAEAGAQNALRTHGPSGPGLPRRTPASPERTQRCVAPLLVAAILAGFAFSPDADPRLRGEMLAAALSRADVEVRDGALRWAGHALRWGIPGAYLLLESDGRPVEVAWSLADPAFDAPLASLPGLLAVAPAETRPPRLRFDPLLDAPVLETRGGFVHEGRSWQRSAPDTLRAAAR